jgi:predicted NBD/HSP70 family sugar kinase
MSAHGETHPTALDTSLSLVLGLVAAGKATTRSEIARVTGLARSTVSQRVDALRAGRLIVEGRPAQSTGGRPPIGLLLDPRAGVVLAADLGATHCRLAVAGLSRTVLAEQAHDLDIAHGPDAVLTWLLTRFGEILESAGRTAADVRAVGIGVPGPVEFSSGTVVRPPIMPGWDAACVPRYFAGHYGAPVLVDNDVNVMALGEAMARDTAQEPLLFIKIGTGIGCGIVSQGAVHRGADGAAGDIGHIATRDSDHVPCRCGNEGCIEAVASGSALARELSQSGLDASTSQDVAHLALQGNPTAVRSVRVAATRIGEVIAALVNFYNPSTIVIGGALAPLRDDLLAGIRAVVYRRATPLATRALTIEASRLSERAGVVGAIQLAHQHLFSPRGVQHLLSSAAAGPHRPGPGSLDEPSRNSKHRMAPGARILDASSSGVPNDAAGGIGGLSAAGPPESVKRANVAQSRTDHTRAVLTTGEGESHG